MNKSNYPDYYVGYVGFNATFGAKYFGGYARGFKADKITPRDYTNEAYKNLCNQIPKIQNITFSCSDYIENKYSDMEGAVIYCDPPYFGTTEYTTNGIDYDKFWDWCRKMSKSNFVFVSEYSAPDDFECVWEKKVSTSLDISNMRHRTENRVEKLFTYKKTITGD